MRTGSRNRIAGFVSRRWPHALILATVVVSALFLVCGIAAHWGSSQWGSYGQCVGSAATFVAVVIALRESFRSQRERAVDHEVSRRRECLKAIGDVWTGLTQMALYFTFFTDYLENLPEVFDPNIQRQDNVPPDRPGEALAHEIGVRVQDFVNRWAELVEPPIFVALALLKDTPFDEPMKDINTKIRHLMENELAGVLNVGILGRRPNIASFDARWKEIVRSRESHLNLARKHFSLDLRTVETELIKSR